MRRALLALLIAAVGAWLLARPEPALGHAALVRSEPSENAFVQRPPSEVILVFSEPVEENASGVRLLDASGSEIRLGAVEVSGGGMTMRAATPALGPGIYNVLWVNVSRIDGHSLRGAFPFTVLNPDGSVPGVVNTVGGLGTDPDPPPRADGVAVRVLSLLGMAIVAGAAIILLLWPAAPAPVRKGIDGALLVGAGVLLLATSLNLPVLRDAYRDTSLGDLLGSTQAGRYWLLRAGAALGIGVAGIGFWQFRPRLSAVLLLGGLAAYLWGYSATSHAAAGTGSGWATAIDVLHGLAAVSWIGAVTGLALSARLAHRDRGFARFMPRFSLLASMLVFVLLATGALSAIIEVDASEKLTGTRYGVTLLVKLGAAALLLGVAAYNARRGSRRLAALAPGEPRRFVRTATAEVLLGLAVFVLAAMLTQTTTAKSISTTRESKPFAQTATAADLAVILTIDPNRVGLNSYGVGLTGKTGAADAQRVRLTFRYQDDQSIGASSLVLAASGERGQFSGQGPFLTLEGRWRVEVEVRRADTDDAIAFFDVRPAGGAFASVRRGGRWDNPASTLTWNEFGGLVTLMFGAGVAIWGGRLARRRKRLTWAVNTVLVATFGFGLLLLFGVHAHESSGNLPVNPVYPDQDSIARGRALYEQNCISCHGQFGVPPKGLDLNPYPLDLSIHVPQHPDGDLYNFIAKGLPGSAMRAWSEGQPKLSSEQMWHLVNFLRTLGAVDQ